MKQVLIFAFMIFASCGKQASKVNGNLPNVSSEELQVNYEEMLTGLKTKIKNTSLENMPKLLENYLVDSIFEYWYDTEWDYNGTTLEPRKGKIACGYFVTTTLKQLGLNIDRVFLAQQASSVLIKEVCDGPSIKIFTNGNYKKMKDYVKKYNGNIFIAGLDNHVGFIVREEGELYFIHSSGISPYKVVKDKMDESGLIVNSKYHMVGHLNFKHWAKGLKNS
jgi:hypothetical protein